jgi:hypothetical protein
MVEKFCKYCLLLVCSLIQFTIYEGIELRRIYRLEPSKMEYWYLSREKKRHDDKGKDINNPKFPYHTLKIMEH